MTNPYRNTEQKEEKIETASLVSWVQANFIGAIGTVLAIALAFGAIVWVANNLERIDRESATKETARAAKVNVCYAAGSKNAAAWARFMGIKTPAISCRWESTWGAGPECGDHVACAVGTGDGSAVYSVRCWSGDGVERDGDPNACELLAGRR